MVCGIVADSDITGVVTNLLDLPAFPQLDYSRVR
jgi:hypothetical protein